MNSIKFSLILSSLLFTLIFGEKTLGAIKNNSCDSLFHPSMSERFTQMTQSFRRTGGRSFFVHEVSSADSLPRKAFGLAVQDDRILDPKAGRFKKFFHHIPSVLGSALALEKGYRLDLLGPLDWSAEVVSERVLKQKKKHWNSWVKFATSIALAFTIDLGGKYDDWLQGKTAEAYQSAEVRWKTSLEADKKNHHSAYVHLIEDFRFKKTISRWKSTGSRTIGDRLIPYSEAAAIDYIQKSLMAYEAFAQIQESGGAPESFQEMIEVYGKNPLFADVIKFTQKPREAFLKNDPKKEPIFNLKTTGFATEEQIFKLFNLKIAELTFINLVDYWISFDGKDISPFLADRESARRGQLEVDRVKLFAEVFNSGYLNSIVKMFNIKSDMSEAKKTLFKNVLLEYFELIYFYESFNVLEAEFIPISFEEQLQQLKIETQEALAQIKN